MRRALIVALAVFVSACGSDPAPTAPSPPPPVPTPAPAPAPLIANFAGNWAGTYAVTTCDQAGDIRRADWCGLLRGVSSPGLTLRTTQDGRTVSAVLALGIDIGTVAGHVTEDGHLILNGQYATSRDGAVITTILGGWDSTLMDATHQAGHFAVSESVAGYSGNIYFEATITLLTR